MITKNTNIVKTLSFLSIEYIYMCICIFFIIVLLYVCNNISLINKSKQKNQTKSSKIKPSQTKTKITSHHITSHQK